MDVKESYIAFDDDYCFLGTKHPGPFVLYGLVYANVAQYCAYIDSYYKGDYNAAVAIQPTVQPHLQKYFGFGAYNRNNSAWHKSFLYEQMMFALQASLAQNKQMAQKLLATGSKNIILCNKDLFWGSGIPLDKFKGGQYPGANTLGRILVLLRDRMKNTKEFYQN